ncbi:hypothetical protein SNE40_014959 [Patella caerulea]|uniref:VWFA domain-containing protein n=1 Tax=Patella caerulea TaxID=87958 RepID=A0AAN8PI98_PATCE
MLCKKCIFIAMCCLIGQSTLAIRLVNNGYENVVISIGKDVKEDSSILQRIEDYLTVTSAALFTATKHRIYFREITIVIPQTWTHNPSYSNAKDSETEHSQILIDVENPAYGHAPYVKQYAECGQPGLYIHLTPEYLIKDEITFRWGLPGKTLAHEWAHLRWGLFDEYPIDPQDSPFYRYNGQWHPTRCSTEVEGVLKNENSKEGCLFDMFTGKPSASCKFFPRMKQNKAVASIMFMQYLESVVEFCDDSYSSPFHLRHNNLAPNRQNRLCNYRSAWEVMRKHSDFSQDTKQLPEGYDTQPYFRYVQVRPRRRVLVLDTSGSMTGSSLKILRQAASNFIMNTVETGSSLGIVEFNTEASTLSDLVSIQSREDREILISRLPTTATGKTSIGGGLNKAIEALRFSKSGVGGTLILITDGQENQAPWIKDIKPSLLEQGVMVHALAYGQKAETDISQLAGETGGRTFFFSGERQASLVESLAAMVRQKTTSEGFETPITIISETQIINRNTPHKGMFHIDSDLGKDTVLTFMHQDPIDVVIRGPDNTTLAVADKSSSFDQTLDGGMLRISLNGTIAPGEWTYEINSWRMGTAVTTSVISQSNDNKDEIIHTNSWISQSSIEFDPKGKFAVFTEVRSGNAPVLEAVVYASFEGPSSASGVVNLKDNGVGSDLIKGDGIYSAYILTRDLAGDGRYNIKITVTGYNDSTKIVTKGGRSGALAIGESDGVAKPELKLSENFERVTSAGEFRVIGFPTNVDTAIPDIIPPSRITDFLVTSFDQDTGETSLSWTAVGDDMDRGTASRYYIHLANNVSSALQNLNETTLVTDLHILEGSLEQPKEPGELETITLNVTSTGNNTIYVVIRTSDKENNFGDVSNIVTLSYTTEMSIKIEARTTYMEYITMVLIPVSAFLFVLVFVTCACICWTNKAPRNTKMEEKRNSVTSFDSTDLTYMNYAMDGEYVVRVEEEAAPTWRE